MPTVIEEERVKEMVGLEGNLELSGEGVHFLGEGYIPTADGV